MAAETTPAAREVTLDGSAPSPAELTAARHTVTVLEALVGATSDEATATQLGYETALLKLSPLGDRDGAAAVLRGLLQRRAPWHVAMLLYKVGLQSSSRSDQALALTAASTVAPNGACRAAVEVMQSRLKRDEKASITRQHLRAAILAAPNHLAALLGLLDLERKERTDAASLAKVCKRIADATHDPAIQAEYLAWAGRFLETTTQAETARELGAEAGAAALTSPAVLFLAERLASRARPDERIELTRRLASEGVCSADEGQLEIALIALYDAGDHGAAIEALQAIAATGGESTRLVDTLLADAHLRRGDYAASVEARKRALREETDATTLAHGWAEVARLCETHLGDARAAATAWVRSLEANFNDAAVLRAAEACFRAIGASDKLVWLYLHIETNAATPEERAWAARQAGEVLLRDGQSIDKVVAHFRIAYNEGGYASGHFFALDRALRAQGDYRTLVTLMTELAATAVEPTTQAWLLLEAAELTKRHLTDPSLVLNLLRKAVGLPIDEKAFALRRLVAELSASAAEKNASTTLQTELETRSLELARVVSDPIEAAAWFERVATDQLERQQIAAAKSTFAEGLRVAPFEHSLRAAARDFYRRTAAWEELIALQQVESGLGRSSQLGDERELVWMLRNPLKRPAEGITHLEKLCRLHPKDLSMRFDLAQVYEDARNWPALLTLLESLPPTPILLVKRAIAAERAGQASQAIDLWTDAQRRGVALGKRPCMRLLASLGRWIELAATYDAATESMAGNQAVHAHYRAAEVAAEKLGDVTSALTHLAAARRHAPDSVCLLLAELRLREPTDGEFAERAFALCERIKDPEWKETLYSLVASSVSLDTETGRIAATSHLALAPRDPIAMARIECLLEKKADREGLVALLGDVTRDSKVDAAIGQPLLVPLGERLVELGRAREAADVFEKSLSNRSGSSLARLQLPALYAKMGDDASEIRSLAALAEDLPVRWAKSAVLRRLAEVHQRLGQQQQAWAMLEQALIANPADYTALKQFAAEIGPTDPARLVDPLMRSFEAETDTQIRRDLGLHLATRLIRLERFAPARQVLDRLRADLGDDLRVLLLKAEVETRDNSFGAAVEALKLLSEHSEAGPEVQLDALRRLIGVLLYDLDDLEAARALTERLEALDARDPESIELRLDVAERTGNSKAAAALIAEVLRQPDLDEERRANLQLELASLQEIELDDPIAAINTLGEIRLPARRRDAVERLLDLGGSSGRWDLAASALETTLDRTGDMDLQWELAIRSRLANLLEGPLARNDAAVRQYKRIVEIDRNHGPALERLAELTVDSAPAEAIDYHLALLAADPTRLSAYRTLRQLYMRTENEDGAFLCEAVMEGLGVSEEEERYFYNQHRARLTAPKDGVLSDDERDWLAAERHDPAWRILHALSPALPAVFAIDFGGYGVAEIEKATVPEFAKSWVRFFGVPACRVVFAPARVAPCVELGVPPVAIVPRGLDEAPPRERAAVLGELMGRIVFGAVLSDPKRHGAITPQWLEHVVWAACELVNPAMEVPQKGKAIYEDVKRRLGAALDAKAKAELAPLVEPFRKQPVAMVQTLAAMERVAWRAAIVAAQDPAVALAYLRNGPLANTANAALPLELAVVLASVVSRPHLKLRQRIGLGVSP